MQVPLTIHPQFPSVPSAPDAPSPSFPPTTVRPGDVIVADIDGVVCIPVEQVDEVLELCGKGKAADEKIAEAIRQGKGVQESFKQHRQNI